MKLQEDKSSSLSTHRRAEHTTLGGREGETLFERERRRKGGREVGWDEL